MRLLNRIYHRYGNRLVLENASLSVAPGEIVAIVGPSGCGKTTLLRAIAGLLEPTAGTVVADRAETACAFQDARLLPWLTVLDNLALGLAARGIGRAERRSRARGRADALDLADAIALYPHQISGGMAQRVNLGRALAVEPRLLLLDEPFSSLDPGMRQRLQTLTAAWVRRRRAAAVMVTHDWAEAVQMADRLVVLSARPARPTFEWTNERPPAARDPAYCYRAIARLQRQPEVAASFGWTAIAGRAGESPGEGLRDRAEVSGAGGETADVGVADVGVADSGMADVGVADVGIAGIGVADGRTVEFGIASSDRPDRAAFESDGPDGSSPPTFPSARSPTYPAIDASPCPPRLSGDCPP